MPKKRGNRARGSLRGRGDYSASTLAIKDPMNRLESKIDHLEKKLVKDIMSKSSAAATIGRTLGNFAGQGDLGALAGASLAKYFGHGDYQVRKNSLMSGNPHVGATFSKDGRRGTRITEREYIGDILSGPLTGGSTDFTVSSFDLNPTDSNTFPWLSRMANLFDQWEPNGIVVEFISTSSDFNGSSQALGAVIISTDYDGYDPTFLSKQEMENADYACSTKPSENLLHGVECDPTERPVHILYTSTTGGAPITSTTLGKTQVATQGCSQANVTLGELWISYDITFYKKQLHDSLTYGPLLSFTGTLDAGPSPYFGVPTVSRSINLEQVIGTGSRINFNNSLPGEQFMLEYAMYNGATSSDETEFYNAALTGCTREYRLSRDAAGTLLFIGTYTTTVPNASILIGMNDSGAHGYAANIFKVSSDLVL